MRLAALSAVVVLAIGVSACGGVENGGVEDDGPVGAASQAEVDPGLFDYLIYGVWDDNGILLAQVLVTATSGAGYDADREYWYVYGTLNTSTAATFIGGSSQYWSTPPTGLGTLSFTMSRTPTWTSGGTRGTMPVYYNPLTGEYDAMHWEMSNSSGTWTGQIVWYSNWTGNLFGPGVSRRLAPTSTSGIHYYFVNTPL